MLQKNQYYNAYIAGYRDGIADAFSGKAQANHSTDPSKIPITVLGLSTRACNCLLQAHCQTVAAVRALDAYAVQTMRNLGPKTAEEIAHWLVEHYYFSSAWVQCL